MERIAGPGLLPGSMKAHGSALGLAYEDFKKEIVSQCVSGATAGFDTSESMQNPGVIRLGAAYCAYYYNCRRERLFVSFGREEQEFRLLDFSVVPVLSACVPERTVVVWVRPYCDHAPYSTGDLASVVVDTLSAAV